MFARDWRIAVAGDFRHFESICTSSHVGFGLALIAYAALTFGGAALVNR